MRTISAQVSSRTGAKAGWFGSAPALRQEDATMEPGAPSGRGTGSARTGRISVLAALGACLALTIGSPAQAGELRGEIKIEPNRLGAPPVRNQGFVARIENPFRAPKPFAPWPYMVVVLEGEAISSEDKQPPARAARYELLGQSFATAVFPVVAGAEVEIYNKGPEAILVTPDDPDLLDVVAIKRRGAYPLKIKESNRVVIIRSQDGVHLEGRVVSFPHRYFAKVDARGTFVIGGVPEGTFTARVWYRDRWLDGADTKVEVGRWRTDLIIKVSPDRLLEPQGKTPQP